MQYQVAREAVGSKSWETRCRGHQDQQYHITLDFLELTLDFQGQPRDDSPKKTSDPWLQPEGSAFLDTFGLSRYS